MERESKELGHRETPLTRLDADGCAWCKHAGRRAGVEQLPAPGLRPCLPSPGSTASTMPLSLPPSPPCRGNARPNSESLLSRTDGRHGAEHLSDVQLVQDGGLAGCIQACGSAGQQRGGAQRQLRACRAWDRARTLDVTSPSMTTRISRFPNRPSNRRRKVLPILSRSLPASGQTSHNNNGIGPRGLLGQRSLASPMSGRAWRGGPG